MDVYPDAKVLLSVRDAEARERSVRDTVWAVYDGDSLLIRHLSIARAAVNPGRRRYLELVNRVKSDVPAEQLLVWNSADGWNPSAAFLTSRCRPCPPTSTTAGSSPTA